MTYQNTALIKGVFKLVSSQNLSLFENFKREHFLVIFLLYKENFTITALANNLDGAEVTHGDCASSRDRPVTQQFHLVD